MDDAEAAAGPIEDAAVPVPGAPPTDLHQHVPDAKVDRRHRQADHSGADHHHSQVDGATIRTRLRAAAEERRRLVADRDASLRGVVPHDRRVTGTGGESPVDVPEEMRKPLTERPTVRFGIYAWSAIGILVCLVVLGFVVATLHGVVVPLVVALFPAAVLAPLVNRLVRHGVPAAGAAAIVLASTLALVGTIGAVIAPLLAGQLQSLSDSIEAGYAQVDRFLATGPFGLQPIRLNDLVSQVSDGIRGGVGGAADSALGFAVAFFEGAATIILTLIVLFFYLKDGRRIGQWIRTLFPKRFHVDVDHVGDLIWRTIGGYIQGQLLVAIVDAVFIGLGLWLLGVPLALPLGVIVFFGGLLPIVGASISGFLAALVALATNGPGTALLVIAVVVAVQFLEGHLLQPLILGRALQLHPLAIVMALAMGGFLLGILGAFLAVPVAAATAQTVGYIRRRVPG